MQKSHFSITLIIGDSCLFKLLLDKTDSSCHNTAEVITFTYGFAYCFVFVMKVKVNNSNWFFSQPPNNLLFSSHPLCSKENSMNFDYKYKNTERKCWKENSRFINFAVFVWCFYFIIKIFYYNISV